MNRMMDSGMHLSRRFTDAFPEGLMGGGSVRKSFDMRWRDSVWKLSSAEMRDREVVRMACAKNLLCRILGCSFGPPEELITDFRHQWHAIRSCKRKGCDVEMAIDMEIRGRLKTAQKACAKMYRSGGLTLKG